MTPESDSSFDAMLREAAQLRVPTDDCVRLPELGELLEDKYRIEAKLGEGGMGAVFRATNIENGKPVAVKWLLSRSSKACARFSREAQVAAQIDHPNVVNVFDLGAHRGGRYLVMELLRGASLGARVRAGRVAPLELVAIMVPVLRGIAAAHAARVIHRDLKPDNVFLCVGPDGAPRQPKVLDFGISKLRTEPPLNERLTSEGTGLGTPAYMSPEQLVDAPNVDERTDIYAAGVMMYEALVGRLPFEAESHNALVLAIAAQRPLPMTVLVPELPSALERIVMRAMAKDPGDRQPSAEALIAELEAWQYASQHATEPEKRREMPQPAARSGNWALRGVLLAACVLAWWLIGRSHTPPIAANHATHAQAASVRPLPASFVSSETPQAAATGMATPSPAADPKHAILPGPGTRAQPGATARAAKALSASIPTREKSRAGSLRLSDL